MSRVGDLLKRVESSILGAHIGEAETLGRRWICPGCGTAQTVDEAMVFPLHLVNLIERDVRGKVTQVLASGICSWSYAMTESARQQDIFGLIDEQTELFKGMRDSLARLVGEAIPSTPSTSSAKPKQTPTS